MLMKILSIVILSPLYKQRDQIILHERNFELLSDSYLECPHFRRNLFESHVKTFNLLSTWFNMYDTRLFKMFFYIVFMFSQLLNNLLEDFFFN